MTMAATVLPPTIVPHTVQIVTIGELAAFAETVAAGKVPGVTPINRLRAQSLARNPSASPDDAALFYPTTPDGVCQGYIGVMPARLVIDGLERKIGWLTTGYSVQTVRRTTIISNTFDTAESVYETLMATGASPEASKLYRRRGYAERICHDFVSVSLARISLRTIGERIAKAVRLRVRHQNDKAAAVFRRAATRRGPLRMPLALAPGTLALRAASGAVHSKWSDRETAWLLERSWFTETFQPTSTELGYFFHVPRKVVSHHCLELTTPDGRPRGGAVVSLVEDGAVSAKILDVFYGTPQDRADVVRAAFVFALEHGAKSLYLNRHLLTGFPRAAWLRLVARPAPLSYFFKTRDPDVQAVIPTMQFATTDCDMAFW